MPNLEIMLLMVFFVCIWQMVLRTVHTLCAKTKFKAWNVSFILRRTRGAFGTQEYYSIGIVCVVTLLKIANFTDYFSYEIIGYFYLSLL